MKNLVTFGAQHQGVFGFPNCPGEMIFFCDIVSFTSICSDSTAHQIIEFLNDLYHMFDDRIDNFDVYKVSELR